MVSMHGLYLFMIAPSLMHKQGERGLSPIPSRRWQQQPMPKHCYSLLQLRRRREGDDQSPLLLRLLQPLLSPLLSALLSPLLPPLFFHFLSYFELFSPFFLLILLIWLTFNKSYSC